MIATLNEIITKAEPYSDFKFSKDDWSRARSKLTVYKYIAPKEWNESIKKFEGKINKILKDYDQHKDYFLGNTVEGRQAFKQRIEDLKIALGAPREMSAEVGINR